MASELEAFDYRLPPEQIAQEPAPQRDSARLLVLDRGTGSVEHAQVRDLPRFLRRGDLLVLNATRVLPASLRGRKLTGGAAQALLLGPAESVSPGTRGYRALVRTRGRLRAGLELRFGADADPEGLSARIASVEEDGIVVLEFPCDSDPYRFGETPLPPYIRRSAPRCDDRERYQTVFARVPGSVAAPTAGLHFTPDLLTALEQAGVERSELVLHVGPGTFRPLREADLSAGCLHAETFELPPACAEALERARARGGRIIAGGTTSARVLESCVGPGGRVEARSGETRLFLRPGSRFQVSDALLTNFHLPRSSLLLLVMAFAGRERVLRVYEEAIRTGYRFYSYGDAMLIL